MLEEDNSIFVFESEVAFVAEFVVDHDIVGDFEMLVGLFAVVFFVVDSDFDIFVEAGL